MIHPRLAPEQFDTIPEIPEPAENPILIGHDDAAAQLAAAYRAGRLHHALLLTGPRGIGKGTFAFHLAHHLLANPTASEAPPTFSPRDPGSSLFRQVAQGAHPGVLHLTRPANDKTKGFKSVITVEEVRRVGRFLSMTAHDGSYRVVIVDPAEDMNTNAANALLKNLEEPPPRALFVLIAHAPGRLLPTIRSRCQTIKLKPLGPDELIRALEGVGAQPPEGEAERRALVARAGGSPREAIMLTAFGGLEIAGAVAGVVGAAAFPIAEAWRVAEAVGGRDSAVQFSLFNQIALDMIATAAGKAASAGDGAAADAHSQLWTTTSRTLAETETYNLDKKQHVMSLLQRMHEALGR